MEKGPILIPMGGRKMFPFPPFPLFVLFGIKFLSFLSYLPSFLSLSSSFFRLFLLLPTTTIYKPILGIYLVIVGNITALTAK